MGVDRSTFFFYIQIRSRILYISYIILYELFLLREFFFPRARMLEGWGYIHKGWRKKKEKNKNKKRKKKENFTGFRIDRVESLNSAWNNISAKTIKIWKGRANNGLRPSTCGIFVRISRVRNEARAFRETVMRLVVERKVRCAGQPFVLRHNC